MKIEIVSYICQDWLLRGHVNTEECFNTVLLLFSSHLPLAYHQLLRHCRIEVQLLTGRVHHQHSHAMVYPKLQKNICPENY
jgi:hypothetical protein